MFSRVQSSGAVKPADTNCSISGSPVLQYVHEWSPLRIRF